jgi:hypothetical protein
MMTGFLYALFPILLGWLMTVTLRPDNANKFSVVGSVFVFLHLLCFKSRI